MSGDLDPEEILSDLLKTDSDLNLERYWGERSLFYNPGRARPLGVIWVSVKDHDGENDRSSQLNRNGIYRLSFQLARDDYRRRFGALPPRPPKGGVVQLRDYDPTKLNTFMPHPVYAWMAWTMILTPSRAQFASLRPLMLDSLDQARLKWRRAAG